MISVLIHIKHNFLEISNSRCYKVVKTFTADLMPQELLQVMFFLATKVIFSKYLLNSHLRITKI